MDIVTYARLNGVLIDRLIEDGRWHRCATEDHPKKKNGAYMTRGSYGFIQNHAVHTEPVKWEPDANEVAAVDVEAIQRRAREAAEQIRRDQEAAAKRAGWILHQCAIEPHPYLEAKGFPNERGNVWHDPKAGDAKLCLPMRADGRLVGLQTISDAPGFEKKFLYGQRTSEACYLIDNKGPRMFCEGYATGLSVAAAMHALKRRFTLVITFTAGNLLKVARNHGTGFIVADYDHPNPQAPYEGGTGLKVAREAGLPFWTSGKMGVDFNDYHQQFGLFRAAQALNAAFFVRAKG